MTGDPNADSDRADTESDHGPEPATYSMERYLAAKRSVDDRALDEAVLDTALTALERAGTAETGRPASVVEVGTGIGTMVERLLEIDADRLPERLVYDALDVDADLISIATDRLPERARALGYDVTTTEAPGEDDETTGEAGDGDGDGDGDGSAIAARITITGERRRVTVRLRETEGTAFARRTERTWDLLIAGSVLDLLPGVEPLATLFELVPDGAFYFPVTFDGATRFRPGLDDALDRRVERRYHASMRERADPAVPRAGSGLFDRVPAAGGRIDAVAGSDWIVRPRTGADGAAAYPGDEAYFLYHVLNYVADTIRADPALGPAEAAEWIRTRREQVADGQLTYLAHNLDVFGRVDGSAAD